MLENNIVRDSHFEEVTETRVDSKNRITLGKSKNTPRARIYKVYRNALGQIILDPQVIIPAHEAWLYQNPKVLASVKRGLRDAARGKVVGLDPDKE